jgi:hypothetical protein
VLMGAVTALLVTMRRGPNLSRLDDPHDTALRPEP